MDLLIIPLRFFLLLIYKLSSDIFLIIWEFLWFNKSLINGFLEKCILKSEILNLCKELILKYENSYSREINLNVYLLLKIDINKFLIEIKKSTIKNQIDFLTHNISYLAKKCQNNEVDSFNFFSYLNELIIITDDKEFTGLMLEKVMNHKYIIKFYKKNLDKLNNISSSEIIYEEIKKLWI